MNNKILAFRYSTTEDILTLSDQDYGEVLAYVEQAESSISVIAEVTKSVLQKARGKNADKRLGVALSHGEGQIRRAQALAELRDRVDMIDMLARAIYPEYNSFRGFIFTKKLGKREHELFLRIIDIQIYKLYWQVFEKFTLGEHITFKYKFFNRHFKLEDLETEAPRMVLEHTSDRFLYFRIKSPISCLFVRCRRHGNRVVFCIFSNPKDVILDYALEGKMDGNEVINKGKYYVSVSNSLTLDKILSTIKVPDTDVADRAFLVLFQRLLEELYDGDQEKFKEDIFLQIAKILAFEKALGMYKDLPLDLFQETFFLPFYRSHVLKKHEGFKFPDEEFYSQFFDSNITPQRKKQLLFAFLFVPIFVFEKDQKTCFDPLYFGCLIQFIYLFIIKDENKGWTIDWDALWTKFSQIKAIIQENDGIEILDNRDIVRIIEEELGVGKDQIGITVFKRLVDIGFLSLEDEFTRYWHLKVSDNKSGEYGKDWQDTGGVKIFEDYFISKGLLAREGEKVHLTLEGELIVRGVPKDQGKVIAEAQKAGIETEGEKINNTLIENKIGALKLKLDESGRIKIGKGLNDIYFDFGEGYKDKEIVLVIVNGKFIIYCPEEKKVILGWQDMKVLTEREFERPANPQIKREEKILGFVFPYKRDEAAEKFCKLLKVVEASAVKYSVFQKQLPRLNFEVYDGAAFEINENTVKIPGQLLNRELTGEDRIKLALLLIQKLEKFLGDVWILIVIDILESNNLMKELLDFIGEVKGIELDNKDLSETLKKTITRIRIWNAVKKMFLSITETQSQKLEKLFQNQLVSPPGDVIYYSTKGSSEFMVHEPLETARIGKKIAVGKAYKNQLYFSNDGQLCFSKNGDTGEVVYVIYRNTQIIILNEEGKEVSEDVKYTYVYRLLEEEGLSYILDIYDDFNLVRENCELFVNMAKGLRKLIQRHDGIKEWLLSFGHNFTEEYFKSIEETMLKKCFRLVEVNTIKSNPAYILGIFEAMLLYFMETVMLEGENLGKELNPVVFSAFMESIVESVLIKYNKGEFSNPEAVGIWLDNIWISFKHDYSNGRKRFSRNISKTWQFPSIELEEKIYGFFSYFFEESHVELETDEDSGIKPKVEDSSKVVLSSKVRKGSKWLKASDQLRIDEAFVEAFNRLYDEIEKKSTSESEEVYRRQALRELRLLAEILMKLSNGKGYIAFVPMEIWGGEKVSILMDLFRTKTWVHILFGEEKGKDLCIRLKVRIGDLSLNFRIDYPPGGNAHFNIEGENILRFYGPHHDYNLSRVIQDRKSMKEFQTTLRGTINN